MEDKNMSQCKAMSKRSGERCRKHASKGRNACSMHGGKSLRGVDSPRFKTGRYSKYLPDRLAEKYHEALADEELLRLDDEIALVDARLGDVLSRMTAPGESSPVRTRARAALGDLQRALIAGDDTHDALTRLDSALTEGLEEQRASASILTLIEQRRRLVDTERKRLADEDHAVTIDKLMLFMAALLDIIRRHVASPETRKAIADEVRALIPRADGPG
jgi:hypothetical protein